MKKMVSFLLALCLLLGVCLPASALTAADFTDIPNNWAKPAIEYCLENGLMNGEGSGKFNPGGKVTRAQIAQALYNKEGQPGVEGLANPFTDANGWFKDAVVWCKANGVVNGSSDTTFNPTSQVKRQDICVMVYRYITEYKKLAAELTDESKMESTFTDWGKVAGYAKEAIRWANKAGFMSGTSAATLDPAGQATRVQLAQFLMNLDKVLAEKPDNKPTPSPTPDTKPTPTPSPSPTPAPDKPMYTENPAPETRLAGERDSFGKALAGYVDPRFQGMFDGNDPDFAVYKEMDFGSPRAASEGADYTSLVPIGGYVDGASHAIGKTLMSGYGYFDIVKADYGTRYNKYGVNVSSVDGLQSNLDHQIAFYIHSRMGSGGVQGSGSPMYDRDRELSKKYDGVDTAFQICAEAMNCEAAENLDNLTHAGLTLQIVKRDSTRHNTFELSILNGSPEVSRRLVELSKTCTSRDELIAALCSEYNVSSWEDIPGLMDDRIKEICDGEWYVNPYIPPNWTRFFDTATVTFDHTPSAGEVMQQLDVVKDGTMSWYFTDTGNHKIFAVAVDEINNIATYIQVCDNGNMAGIAQQTDYQWTVFKNKTSAK